ncbi:MAG TPA: excisionase family DNA-binding protein [Bryobacteraceae bacterium]|jgi:excisionase family DNA binding protein|nr:excisionase family DNA-binding protein [Bryobacteraceae bacterium]
MASLAHSNRHSAPTTQDASLARVSGQRLACFARRKKPLSLKVTEAGQEHSIELPAGAVALLMDILAAMAAGRGVTIVPENAELTTVEAANILNVSRPYLIKLLEEKVIPHRLVGKHRRILIDDLMAYKQHIDAERENVLEQLTAAAQRDEMGYSRS